MSNSAVGLTPGEFQDSIEKAFETFKAEIFHLHKASYADVMRERDSLRRELDQIAFEKLAQREIKRNHRDQETISLPVMEAQKDHVILEALADGGIEVEEPEPSEKVLENWSSIVQGAAMSISMSRKVQKSKVTLALKELWVAKQSAQQAGFAAASKLRLNITTDFKTGDQMLGTSLLQRFVMNPYGATRLAWGVLGVAMIFWDLVVIPLTVFNLGRFEAFVDIMSVVTFIYWAIDLPGTFLVGVDVDGTLDMRPGPIAKKYLTGWFFPDFLILLIDIVLFIMTAVASDASTPQALRTASLVRLLRLFRIVRLVRLHKAASIVEVIMMRVRSEYLTLVLKILRQSMIIIVVNHYIACAWFACSDNIEGPDTWVNAFGLKHADVASQYLVSFHWAVTQFAPATNNVAPQNAIERAFASLIVIYAFVAFSSFVSAMTNATNELRAFTLKSARQEAQIRKFLGDKKVSSDLWCQIRQFCKAKAVSQMVSEKEIAVLNDIPESLRIMLHEELYQDIVLGSHILSGIQVGDDISQAVKRFCHFCFSEEIFSAKLDVFMDGTEAQRVYVSRGGKCIYWSILLPKNRQTLEGTNWLSELALWAKWHHRGQLVAETTTRFMTLDPKSFATIAASEGGALHAYLRTLGLLLISHAEAMEEDEEVTDLTLGEQLIRAMAKRSYGFLSFGSGGRADKSIRMTHLGEMAGFQLGSDLRRKNMAQ